MENGYGRPSVTQKIWKQILKLKQIQCIFTHWMLLCDQLPPFVQSHSLFVRPLPKWWWAVASGETQFLNSNSKTGVQDPRCCCGNTSWSSRCCLVTVVTLLSVCNVSSPQAGCYVYHPLLPLSTDKNDEPVYADFSVLERSSEAQTVRDSMRG